MVLSAETINRIRSLLIPIILFTALILGLINAADDIYHNRGYSALAGALMHEDRSGLTKARQAFQRSLEFNPENLPGKRGMGIVYIQEDQIQSAQEILNTQQQREVSRVLVSWGDHDYQEGDQRAALDWYRKALLLDDTNARAWCQIGHVFEDQENSPEALQAYEKGYTMGDVLCARPYGMAYYNLEQFDRAISIWKKALSTYPDHKERKEWWLDISFTWMRTNDWQNVLQAAASGLAEYPTEARYYYILGIATYEMTGDLDSALKLLKNAIAVNVQYPGSYRAIGDIYVREGKYQEAIPWYSEAIKRSPDKVIWHLSRAEAATLAGDTGQAVQYYEQAAELFPGEARVHYNLAALFWQENNLDQALESIQKAMDLENPPDIGFILLKARILEAQGKLSGALEEYQAVLSLDPDNREALDAVSRLEE